MVHDQTVRTPFPTKIVHTQYDIILNLQEIKENPITEIC